LILFGIVAVALWLAAASGGVDQNATAQDLQYDSPPADQNDTCDRDLSTTNGDQVDPVLEEFAQKAKITFNAPKEMQLGEDRTIQLFLSPTASFEELTEDLTEPGEILCARIVAGGLTEARLTSPDFKIYPVTPETQSTEGASTSHWEWDIEPTQAGEDKKLHLVISVFVSDQEHPSDPKPQTMEVLDHTMTVNVTFKQRVTNFFNLGETPFLSLFGTFLGGGATVAFVGFIWTRRRRNSSPP